MSLLLAVTLASAGRVKAQDAPTGYPKPNDPPILGHEWKFTYDHVSRSGVIWVGLGEWRRYYRSFNLSSEHTYKVSCQKAPTKESPEAVACELDIQGAIESAYAAAGQKGDVADRELYDDITVHATGKWHNNANSGAILASHPSLKFSIERNGHNMQFANAWTKPQDTGGPSEPFQVNSGVEVTVTNIGIWQFENWPEDYSYNRYTSSMVPNLGAEMIKTSPGPRFSFRIAPETITIAPPVNYELKEFVVDPKFGQGG
ncbi:MAG: hypothetical protein R2911_44560 [Caldilineaceae bacterium]